MNVLWQQLAMILDKSLRCGEVQYEKKSFTKDFYFARKYPKS